jgi:hypothetical protein
MAMFTFARFEEIAGRRSRFEEFTGLLSQFSLDSVLWNCAAVNIGVGVWDGAHTHSETYMQAVDAFYVEDLAKYLKERFWMKDALFVFHRRQLLFLQKQAILHSPRSGRSINLEPAKFGVLLLMASDHLDEPPAFGGKPLETPLDYAMMMSNLLPISEYGDESIGIGFSRTRIMLGPLMDARRNDKLFVDARQIFEDASGIPYADFEAFLLGVQAYIFPLH